MTADSVTVTRPSIRDRRCWCRKPSPGLLIESALDLAAHYHEYYPPYMGLFVGDRAEDESCAKAAGFDFMWANEWRAQA